MSITAHISAPTPRIAIRDDSVFDVRDFAFSGEVTSVSVQDACNVARDHVRKTISPGRAEPIHRTGNSWSPAVYFPPGNYVIDRPIIKPPHVSLIGAGWGRSTIRNMPGWNGTPMTTNRQGLMWVHGPLPENSGPSALIWCEGDVEWPPASGLKVAGMVDEISGLSFKCADGAAIYTPGNQNHTAIFNNWINGWGDGPTGIGIVANNPGSGQQTTNLFMHHNMIEGCRAAIILDRVDIGSIDHNQIESCGNGIYVGSADSLAVDDNLLTCTIPNKPFECGIWIGCGIGCSILNNKIRKVTKSAIKHLGRNSKISGNQISVKNGSQINGSGYAIHLVGPSKQFGGDTGVLGGVHSHHVHDNDIDCDAWPATSFKAIFVDEGQGEKIRARVENNVDGPA